MRSIKKRGERKLEITLQKKRKKKEGSEQRKSN